jgi:pimeloyl-ACP methyl ester carboxylesterase
MDQAVHRCRAPDGSEIAYATVGEGTPLVFTSWWLSHVELDWCDPTLRAFFETLAQRHLVVRYDRPGAGLSGPRHGDLSLAAEVSYARTVVDDCGLRRFALFGTSCGGSTAVALAAERPRAVSHLVLYGTYAHGARIAPPAAQQALEDLVESVWGLGVRTLTDVFLRGASHTGTSAFLARQRATASPRDAARLLRLTFELDVSDVLGQVRAPTLVLHRVGDPPVPARLGRDLARRVPGARFTALPGETHVPWDGQAEAVARETELFLTGTAPPTPLARRIVTLLVVRTRQPGLRRPAVDAILSSAFARFGGRIVRGDATSVVAVFDSPGVAVACAQALRTELAGTTAVPRIGLHVGEVVLRAGLVDGIHADLAERVAEAAEPGEVIATGTTADLLVGEEVAWRERASTELPGVPGVWRLVSIQPDGGSASSARTGEAAAEPSFRREGDVWTLCFAGITARMPDVKGLADLRTLLANPGVPVPATSLAGEPEHQSTEPILDDFALRQYRAWLQVLDQELERADAAGDTQRAASAASERDTLLAELTAATGLSGRQRRLGDPAERAWKAVSARIRDAITRIDGCHPDLGVHLRASVRTGTSCVYQPSQRVPWKL